MIPKTMRAALVTSFHEPLRIEEIPVPELRAGEILVKVEASGVCHTDLHAADGDWPVRPTLPFVPGHEGVGLVVACGAGVRNVKEGDRVGVPWLHSACGACPHCVGGWETLCEAQQNSGYSVDGGFAEYVRAHAAYVAAIPQGLSAADAAPILCAGVTTYKGLKETEARPGQWVVVSGIGGLGHLAVQYARAMGLRVAAIEVDDDKLALASSCGAEVTANARTEDVAAKILKETGGAHGALVTAASVSAFKQALGTLRRGGTCALVGLPPGEFPTPIFDVVLKRITIRGSIVGTRNDLAEALGFAARGAVKAHYQTAPLEAVNDVFTQLRTGQVLGRTVLTLAGG